MYLRLALVTLLLSSFAYSGDKGNIVREKGKYSNISMGFDAGDAVVCRDKKNLIKEAFLLEYMELDMLEENLVQFDPQISDVEYVRQLTDVLEREAPEIFGSFGLIGSRLAHQSASFFNKRPPLDVGVKFLMPPYKVNINQKRVNPGRKNMANCQIEPVVISTRTYRGIEYTVQGEIYLSLSQRDRRGVIIHQALFFSLQKYYGDEDSARTRFIHQRISQHNPKGLTSVIMMEILRQAFLDYKSL
jgi:hypothetical protein